MNRAVILLLAASLAIGCASTGPPPSPALFAEAEAAVRRAESAGAGERAGDLLSKARRAWDEGRAANSRGDGDLARRRLEEAREYGEAAEVKANAERTKSDAAAAKAAADELEMRTRQIRENRTP